MIFLFCFVFVLFLFSFWIVFSIFSLFFSFSLDTRFPVLDPKEPSVQRTNSYFVNTIKTCPSNPIILCLYAVFLSMKGDWRNAEGFFFFFHLNLSFFFLVFLSPLLIITPPFFSFTHPPFSFFPFQQIIS